MNTQSHGIPRFFWAWLPLGLAVVQLIVEAVVPQPTLRLLMSEDGPHEILQALVIFTGFCVGLSILRRFPFGERPWLGAWAVLATLCCFYVAGEEVSWGQWLFHWSTPEYWAHINDQGETNLHNTSSWLDQKPRAVLALGIFVGGLIMPLLQKYKPGLLPARFAVIYPPAILAVTAAINFAFKLSNIIGHHVFHVNLYERVAEVQEFFMYYFVTLYLIVLKRRIFPPAQA